MKNLTLVLLVSILLVSCLSEKEKRLVKINDEARNIISAIIDKHYEFVNNADILAEFEKVPRDSVDKMLIVANKIKSDVENARIKFYKKKAIADRNTEKNNIAIEKKWNNSKAGKIFKKHPEWSKEDCEELAHNKIWIGMTIKMVEYLRGRANVVNKSNYGNGVQFQCCWEDRTPSCFYCGEDGIVTAYN